MKGLAAFVALWLVTSPGFAEQWMVDYGRSRLGFTVSWAKEPFSAVFKSWQAKISFDPDDLAHANADVTVDLASEASDEPDFDDGLKGYQGFQVSQFPTAHFTADHFVHESGKSYVAQGRLSLKGVTKDISLPFTLAIDGVHAHMKGTADVMRTDFGVGQGIWSAPSPVAREIAVTVDIYATRRQ